MRVSLLFFCAVVLFSSLFFSSCERGKNRLEERPIPNPLIRESPQFVRGDSLAGNFSNLLKSARLVAADAGKILKAFVFSGEADYSYRKGEKEIVLKEKFSLRQNSKGEYHFLLQNNRDKGVEVIWTGGNLYFRWRYRPFRIVSKNPDDAAKWQKLAVGRWRAAVELFGPSLMLAQVRTAQYIGREAVVYQIALSKAPADSGEKLPLGTAWEGPVGDVGRGDASKLPRIPLSASGQVWVDLETGLPLKVRFTGRYKIGRGKSSALAEMKLNLRYKPLSQQTIDPPKEIANISQAQDPLDPFAGRKKPFFLLAPPKDD